MRAIIASLLCLASVGAADAQERAKATLAGGCFWCMEPPFDKLDGVISTTSGYTGGHTANPTYEQVSAGKTGHTEAVEIVYDPRKITYAQLLEVFWRNIDPLTANAQFCDKGSQYRSGIFVARRDAAPAGGGVESRGGAAFAKADRDRDRGRFDVLARGGLPPGLLQEEPHPLQALPHLLRPRQASRGGLGARAEGQRPGLADGPPRGRPATRTRSLLSAKED